MKKKRQPYSFSLENLEIWFLWMHRMLCTHAKFNIWNHAIRRLPINFSISSHYANDQKRDFELFSENQLTPIQYKFGLIHCTDTKIARGLVYLYFPNRFRISFIPNKVWFLLFHSPEQFLMKNLKKNLKFKEYFHHSCSFQCTWTSKICYEYFHFEL